MKHLLTSLFLLITGSFVGAAAQTAPSEPEVIRPVSAAYTLEVGSSHLADTYLTPLKYDGMHFGLDYERLQAMKFDPEHWVMRLNGNLGLDKTDNPARNATMWGLMLHLEWGMMRRFNPAPNLWLSVGGSTSLEAGVLYNVRNGNNPASAKGAWTVNLTGSACYSHTFGRLPVTFTYRPTLPVTGVFFAPDYGELYYEIYLGDRSGLAHAAWWGNYFMLDNLLTADLHFGATALRLGYRGKIFSSKANDIVTHIFNHSFVVGVSGEWMSVNPRKGIPTNAKIINATY